MPNTTITTPIELLHFIQTTQPDQFMELKTLLDSPHLRYDVSPSTLPLGTVAVFGDLELLKYYVENCGANPRGMNPRGMVSLKNHALILSAISNDNEQESCHILKYVLNDLNHKVFLTTYETTILGLLCHKKAKASHLEIIANCGIDIPKYITQLPHRCPHPDIVQYIFTKSIPLNNVMK